MKDNIKKQYPFQYYTIRNVDLLEQNSFSFDDYSFNKKHRHELYIGNINGLICRHSYGMPIKLCDYLLSNNDNKLTFLLPENYRECVNDLRGLRKSVTDYFDADSLKDRITVITYKVDNSDIIDKVTELGKSMKFDCAIMNPPYDGTLHLQILEKILKFCDKVVNISPSNCYTCNRLKFSSDIRSYDRFVNSIFSHCVNVFKFSGDIASKIFNIAQGTDLSIQVYDSLYTDTEYLPDKFVNYDNKELEKSICKKMLTRCKTAHWQTYLGDGEYVLNTSHVHGHVGCDDFTNLLCLSYGDALKVKKTTDGRSCQFRFKTDSERKNFYNCYKNSKLIRFWNTQWKNQIILVLKYIPYFIDYSQPWTDERLCKYFDITGYISDTEAEPGTEWETILNTLSSK